MTACAPQPVGGESGDVYIDNVALEVFKWSGTDRAQILETTDKSSNGHRKRKGGLKDMTGSFEAGWKIGKNPGSPTPNFYPGKQVTLKLEITEAGPYYQFVAIIAEIPIENAVDDVVKYSCNFESCGPITRPGEITSSS